MKFSKRHIGVNENDKNFMLSYLGVDSIEELISETIPNNIRLNKNLELEPALSEAQFLNHIHKLSLENKQFKSYIGLGYNQSVLPPVIQRNILENPGWYTAYTPYQAEIAQGRLEALLNYQTVICDLTGMELANASLLDEGTSAAEALSMLYATRSREKIKNASNKFFIDESTFQQTIDVIETRAEPLGIEIIIGKSNDYVFDDSFFGCFTQYTSSHGSINDIEGISRKLESFDIKFVVGADLMSLALLKKPSLTNCEVVIGTSQRFGIPLGYGGPHAGFFATKSKYKRHIPGRIIGVSKDRLGTKALRMALQTREQHIKRERATSNICTAQVLLAVMAGMYAVYHGKDGIKNIATKINSLANLLKNNLEKIDINVINESYFDTLHIKFPKNKIEKLAIENQINFNYINDEELTISINESTETNDIEAIYDLFKVASKYTTKFSKNFEKDSSLNNYKRQAEFLEDPLFNTHQSEASMLRYNISHH